MVILDEELKESLQRFSQMFNSLPRRAAETLQMLASGLGIYSKLGSKSLTIAFLWASFTTQRIVK